MIIEEIKYHHRTRNYAMEQRKRADLSLLSFLRIQFGWSRDLPEKDRSTIAEEATILVSLGEKLLKARAKGIPVDALPPAYVEWASVIEASIQARAPFDAVEKAATKEMERLAVQLPVWDAFAKDVRGFGPRSLAVIVGEAGDLSNYPKKGHLWKRMGLAVMDGVRQGGLAKNAGAEAWIAHGYNKQRRSRSFVIGESLVKQGEHYRKVYLARCHYEHSKATHAGMRVVSPTPATIETWAKRGLIVEKVSKSKFDPKTMIGAGHLNRRAQRYMEKQLLRDLWAAWRRAEVTMPLERAKAALPAEPISLAAKGNEE